jgi:hypothetical protein
VVTVKIAHLYLQVGGWDNFLHASGSSVATPLIQYCSKQETQTRKNARHMFRRRLRFFVSMRTSNVFGHRHRGQGQSAGQTPTPVAAVSASVGGLKLLGWRFWTHCCHRQLLKHYRYYKLFPIACFQYPSYSNLTGTKTN